MNDLKKSLSTKNAVNGVKGICPLSRLKYFSVPWRQTCIDYMHSLLEGVVKNLLNYWFETGDFLGEHSLRPYMQEIERRLLSIRPPKFVPYTPRSIYIHNLWHAHEYLAFILYYALPVFKDIMRENDYQNLQKLVVFIETILSPEINRDDLYKVNLIIQDFVLELASLYSPRIMLSGVHELLHLVDMTLEFGPLNGINCFAFEEMNRKILRFIHGFDLIGEEMIKVFSTSQYLIKSVTNIKNSNLKDFASSRLKLKSSNTKNTSNNKKNNSIVAKFKTCDDQKYLKVINSYTGLNLEQFEISHKVSLNGTIFTSQQIQTLRNDACFSNLNNKSGLIECFVNVNDKLLVLYKQIIRVYQPFYSNLCPEIRSRSTLCYLSEDLKIEEVHNLNKAFLISLSTKETYLSTYKMSHLFN
jgi:hypothetical protein